MIEAHVDTHVLSSGESDIGNGTQNTNLTVSPQTQLSSNRRQVHETRTKWYNIYSGMPTHLVQMLQAKEDVQQEAPALLAPGMSIYMSLHKSIHYTHVCTHLCPAGSSSTARHHAQPSVCASLYVHVCVHVCLGTRVRIIVLVCMRERVYVIVSVRLCPSVRPSVRPCRGLSVCLCGQFCTNACTCTEPARTHAHTHCTHCMHCKHACMHRHAHMRVHMHARTHAQACTLARWHAHTYTQGLATEQHRSSRTPGVQ